MGIRIGQINGRNIINGKYSFTKSAASQMEKCLDRVLGLDYKARGHYYRDEVKVGDVEMVYKFKGFGRPESELYFRAGSIFAVEQSLFNKIPYLVNNQDVLLLKMPLQESYEFRSDTVGVLLALQAVDFKNKVVVDAGSGDGIVTIVALKLGARKVIAIEGDKNKKGIFYKSLADNNIPFDKVEYREMSFREINNRFGVTEADILVSNLPTFGFPSDKLDVKYISDEVENILNSFRNYSCYILAGGEFTDFPREPHSHDGNVSLEDRFGYFFIDEPRCSVCEDGVRKKMAYLGFNHVGIIPLPSMNQTGVIIGKR